MESGSRALGLRIKRVDFLQFRNYDKFNLDEIGNLTVLVGKNGVGKTNVLEGIQLFTSAYSFRHPQISQLIHQSCEEAHISLSAGDGNRELDIALALEPGKKRYSVNGKTKTAADVRGILPSVTFIPDDLQMVKHSSSIKRTTIDNLGMQLTRNYYLVRRDFEKTISYKNRLLRDEAAPILVESINETLVTCGAQLFCLRKALFDRLMPLVSSAYSLLSGEGEEFSATYLPSWDRVSGDSRKDCPSSRDEVREVLALELDKRMEEERRRARCLIGPHNDEIVFYLAQKDAAAYASQGQQRTIVLAWKLAEVQVIREVLGVQPILLLDDVLSELDGSRREMLVQLVDEDIQTFITATDLDGFSQGLVERARVVELPIR